jgi:uncharacterized membrane protein YraQ (UPF0718 family)
MPKETSKQNRGNVIFLLLVIALYAVVFLFNDQLVLNALQLAKGLFHPLLPSLIIIFALLFITNLLIRPDWVRSHLGKESGLKGWLLAFFSGVFSVGPVYPWYALLKELKAKGMRSRLIAVFLYSRAIKLPLLPLMIYYFGAAFTIILISYLTLFSLFSGLLIAKFSDEGT